MRWESVLDRREARRANWHRWYAWYPVQLPGAEYANDGPVIWLEWLYRRKMGRSGGWLYDDGSGLAAHEKTA